MFSIDYGVKSIYAYTGIGQKIGTPMKECNFFICRGLGNHWLSLHLAFDVGLKYNDRTQSSSEFAPIPRAELHRAQVVRVEQEIRHGLCSQKTFLKAEWCLYQGTEDNS